MLDDAELLRRYTHHQDERAFAELVARHVNVVYSAALRQTESDAQTAQDVAQKVFTDLARKAESLAQSLERGKPLIGWLYVSARFAASRFRRTEQRRKSREMVANTINKHLQAGCSETELLWTDLRPLLDKTMIELPEVDRSALLLRYFENKSLRDIGAALDLSEEAARKRISRALDRLRTLLARRGIKTTSAALSVSLATQAVQIAPRGLARCLVRTTLNSATATSAFSLIGLVTANLKIGISVATFVILMSAAVYRINHRSHVEKIVSADSQANFSQARAMLNPERSIPVPPPEDPIVAAALAKIRAALTKPGTLSSYPPPQVRVAMIELGARRQEALPILREALHDADWEVRRRAAYSLVLLNTLSFPDGNAASVAAPDLIEMLRESPTGGDALAAEAALGSAEVKAESIPDLINAMRENREIRYVATGLISKLVEPGSEEALDAADKLQPFLEDPDEEIRTAVREVLMKISRPVSGKELLWVVTQLKAEDDISRSRALSAIAAMKPVTTDAIQALKEFLKQPNREDLKVRADKLLRDNDPGYRQEREDPQFIEAQAARAEEFTKKARAGQATLAELAAALRELPAAIPETARALKAIGYDELRRRSNENAQGLQEFSSAIMMLPQIVYSNEPIESRRAAAEAFAEMQPTRERLLYISEEVKPAFNTIKEALNRLSGEKRDQIEALYLMIFEWIRISRTSSGISDEITDYSGGTLESFARELAEADQRTHDEFVTAMRKADPKFPRSP